MRIGEIAALAGVTPRTVRHYHHLGLFPEPARLPNGYREYGLQHAVPRCCESSTTISPGSRTPSPSGVSGSAI